MKTEIKLTTFVNDN